MSIQKLHYENLGGMLIRREGLLNWRCPLCKAEGQSPEVMRACPECGSKEATLPGAQPAPSFADAYQGAMEEVAIWKKRALEAEELNRKFIAEINGPTYMGEPAQPAPSLASSDVSLISEGKTQPAQIVPTALLVAVADLVAQMEIVARVGFVDTPDDKDSCAAFCVAEGTWLELMKCVESLAASLAAAPEGKS